jgi:hypothetical protein
LPLVAIPSLLRLFAVLRSTEREGLFAFQAIVSNGCRIRQSL